MAGAVVESAFGTLSTVVVVSLVRSYAAWPRSLVRHGGHPDLPVPRALAGQCRSSTDQGWPPGHSGAAQGTVSLEGSARSVPRSRHRLVAFRLVQRHSVGERGREPQEGDAFLPH